MAPNGLELSCPAEAGGSPLLYGTPASPASSNHGPARRVSFSELLGGAKGSLWGHKTHILLGEMVELAHKVVDLLVSCVYELLQSPAG